MSIKDSDILRAMSIRAQDKLWVAVGKKNEPHNWAGVEVALQDPRYGGWHIARFTKDGRVGYYPVKFSGPDWKQPIWPPKTTDHFGSLIVELSKVPVAGPAAPGAWWLSDYEQAEALWRLCVGQFLFNGGPFDETTNSPP